MNARFSKSIVSVLVIAALALAIVPFAGAQEGPQPEAIGLRPDAPPYALHGPYWVGIQDYPITFEYQDSTKRESKVTVWYPALNPDSTLEPFTYPAEKRMIDWAGNLFFPRMGQAFLDAPPNLDGAPFPLILYSHGGSVYRWLNLEYCEHLASFGFVVIATDHEDAPPGTTTSPHAEVGRQWDFSAMIDFAQGLAKSGGILEGMVDSERIGATGTSTGGFTALLAGGAQRNSAEKRAWCASDVVRAFWGAPLVCGDEDARDRQWASLLGLDVPSGELWPDIGDSRVDAVVAVEGFPFEFGPDGISQLRVPAMLLFNRGAPFAMPYTFDALDPAVADMPQVIAYMEDTDHFTLLQPCNEGMITPQTFWLCVPPVWDKQRAHDLFHHLATAFLLATLKDDAEAAAALAPDAVQFPGLTVEAQGF